MDDKRIIMLVKTLKTYFSEELLGYYPETEITSFFHLLCEHILNLSRIDVTLSLYQVVSGKKYHKFQIAIERLKIYEPIQYIIGETEFYGLNFEVNNSVLIPRPETEELVDWIIKENKAKNEINILDIGTGSGCIAIALAKNLNNTKVFALDVSSEALNIAKKNAANNEVSIQFIEHDILNLGLEIKDLKFDIIVSNPPYVRKLEKDLMQDNVLKHEPHLALFVDDDNALLFYKAITKFSKKHLSQNGQLYFEINENLGESTKDLLENKNFKHIELRQDINLKDRMLKGINNE
jgi:release factor glutamine methyltransferase